jgi:hypothetical protein
MGRSADVYTNNLSYSRVTLKCYVGQPVCVILITYSGKCITSVCALYIVGRLRFLCQFPGGCMLPIVEESV